MFSLVSNTWKILEKKQRLNSIFFFVLVTISIFLELLGIGMVFPIIGLILDENFLNDLPFLNKTFFNNFEHYSLITFLLLSLFLIFLAKNLFMLFFYWWQNSFTTKTSVSLAKKLYSKYLYSDYIFHINNHSAKLIRNITSEVFFFQQLLLRLILLLSELLILISILILLLNISLNSSIIAFVFFIFFLSIFTYFAKNMQKKWSIERQKYAEKSGKDLLEGLGSIKEIKIYGKEDVFINQFSKHNFLQANIFKKHGVLAESPRLFIEVCSVGVLVLILYTLSRGQYVEEELLSTVGIFGASAFRMLPSLNRIINSIQNIRLYSSSIPVLLQELSYIPKNKVKLNEKFKYETSKDFIIEFENVDFSYNDKKNLVLKKLKFNIQKGQCIGIIGESGSGKSTLVDILLGLFVPTNGDVLFNGESIFLNPSIWRKNIGYVPQQSILIDDTIKKNIAFGEIDEKINTSKIIECLKEVQLFEFVNNLEHGMDTFVGEKGVKISGGQRQRIAIARALYNDPKILIFDEATSSLDKNTEEKIMKSIYSFKKSRTLIIISHRITSLINCDLWYEIIKGSIREVKYNDI